ncbi:hypothetical protein [Nostoc sp.]|uniref:hypothetical protein n=1 Tax=Nostoc sp. TaxID=1180 RepID=UPI002FFADD60
MNKLVSLHDCPCPKLSFVTFGDRTVSADELGIAVQLLAKANTPNKRANFFAIAFIDFTVIGNFESMFISFQKNLICQ